MKKLLLAIPLIFMTISFQVKHDDRPNILLIVSEDNGPDLGSYGVSEVHTPHLDQLSSEGIQFNNAYVTYSVCSPSRGTIFTGLYPHQNGQIGLATHNFSMYEGIKTLPVFLNEAGYRTGCIGKIHVNPESAVPWDYRPGGLLNGANFGKKSMPLYAEKAGEFINSSDSPFFLMVNYPDAHYPLQDTVEGLPTLPVYGKNLDGSIPFIGADSERLREFTANYYSCMNRLDESVGMLLKTLKESGKEDNTLIIYLGDHGAQFSRGKCSNYEAGLKIPMILTWPQADKRSSHQLRDELVSTIDLLPTILSAAEINIPNELPGKSLDVFYDGKPIEDWRTLLYADGEGSAAKFCFPRRSVRNERYKLIYNLLDDRDNPHVQSYADHINVHFSGGTEEGEIDNAPENIQLAYETWRNPPKYELYDLEVDPLEYVDLSDDPDYDREKQKLIWAMQKWQEETQDPFLYEDKLAKYVAENDANLNTPGRKINWNYHQYFKEELEVIPVFTAGAEDLDGVKNASELYPQYREQNIVVTNSGKILAICQGRNASKWSDRSGQDLVMKSSSDNGKTWEDGKLIATHGLKSMCPNAAVYDGETNQIHVLYNLFMWDYTNKPDDVVGELKDNYSKQYVITSNDEGDTWSEPRDISDMVKTDGAVMVVGSGEGIQLKHGSKKGRLLIAGGDFNKGKKVLCYYSDDHGKTWERSETIPWIGDMSWASESKLAELPDGTLVLNSRTFVKNEVKQRLRTRSFSQDGGSTWSLLENDTALETVSCNGSLIAVEHPKGEQNTILLCSVPVGPRRTHGTIYTSFDGGKTWPVKNCIVPTEFAYSSLMELPDGKIGLFYEARGHRDINLVRLDIAELLDDLR